MSCATDLEESGGAGGRKAPGEKCELRAGQRAAAVLMPSRCGAVTLRCLTPPPHFISNRRSREVHGRHIPALTLQNKRKETQPGSFPETI